MERHEIPLINRNYYIYNLYFLEYNLTMALIIYII